MSGFNSLNDANREVSFPPTSLPYGGAELQRQQRSGAQRGRPVGSTIHDRDSFLKQSVAAYAQHFSSTLARPKQIEIAMGIGVSRPTFLRYLRGYRIAWSEIQNLGLQAAREKEACTCKSNI